MAWKLQCSRVAFSQSCVPVPEGMSTNIPPLITEWETYSQGDMTWEGLEA